METPTLLIAVFLHLATTLSVLYTISRNVRNDIHSLDTKMDRKLEKVDSKIEGLRSEVSQLAQRVSRIEGMFAPRADVQEVAASP